MYTRVESLIGTDNLNKIKNTTVLVVGLGGVGGYVVESLIRSGIENIILIDHDKIDISNLNRQIITTNNNIGCNKTEEFQKRILSINPNCNVIIYNEFLQKDNIHLLSNHKIDYIVDSCDTTATKKLLIDYSIQNNIKIISCMGTANKLDPTKLTICDIRKTSYDPLAKIIRKYVKDMHTNHKIMVVSSTEKPIPSKNLSSMVFVPATAGILCANYIIKDIIELVK